MSGTICLLIGLISAIVAAWGLWLVYDAGWERGWAMRDRGGTHRPGATARRRAEALRSLSEREREHL